MLAETARIYYAHILENGKEVGCQFCEELSDSGVA